MSNICHNFRHDFLPQFPEKELKLNQFASQTISNLPIRHKTLITYRSMYRCHIEKAIGELDLTEVRRTHIQELISPLPPQTSQMTLAVLKSIYREALAQELVEHSPAHGVKGQKVIVSPRRFLTWEEVNRINFGKYNTQIRFLALHGLRWSEAVALTENDIRDGRIYVNKSVHGQTKSKAGVRTVPLVSPFRKFPTTRKALRKALAPHGITIHSLRHTYAYLLKSKGVHVTTAQRLLGHSDPKVTLAIYTQVLDNEIDDTGVMLRSFIGNETASNEFNSTLCLAV
jgi:integrase